MKKNLTELVFILDRSGSMGGLESDTIGGFNSMLTKQKKEEGEANVTTVLFDDKYEVLHDRLDIHGVAPLSDKDYYVRGCTALLDAIGHSIRKIVNVQKNSIESKRAEKVLFVITTDGFENASREYSYSKIQEMITYQKNKYGWEFLFLGANIDAEIEAERLGIDRSRAARFNNDSEGIKLNYQTLNNSMGCYRRGGKIDDKWKDEIVKDYEKRRR